MPDWHALLALFLVLGAIHAPSQGQNFQATLDQWNMVTLVDLDNGQVIMSPNTQPVWGPISDPQNPGLEPQLSFDARSDGYDITYVYDNQSSTPASMGILYVPGIRFGQVVDTRDFSIDGKATTIDHGGTYYFGGGDLYPGTVYSPVALIGEGDYTLGASLQYSPLDYRHRTFVRIESPNDYGGRNWQVRFELNRVLPFGGDSPFSPEGELAPGETRAYVLSVRVLKAQEGQHAGQWLHTLDPYRRYFQCRYGPARYTRDPRPLLGVALAYSACQSPENPLGFYGEDLRPDIHGWQPWVSELEALHMGGWHRITLWAPTGLFYTHPENNYPFQFTSHWNAVPMMQQTLPILAGFPNDDRQLGLWWGHAVRVMTEWDTPLWTLLDPDDPEHRSLAFTEVDGAVAVGATIVGLDSFPELAPWDAYWWLDELCQLYPSMSWVTESMASDLLHALAPSYIPGTRPSQFAHLKVTDPHYLADFLIPWHEIWAAIHEAHIKEELGYPPGQALLPEEVLAVIERYAELGYVPQPFTTVWLDEPHNQYDAVPTWTTTIPPALQIPVYPSIGQEPLPLTVAIGGEATFVVCATGDPPLSFTWYKNGEHVLDDGTHIFGATTDTLTIDPVGMDDAGHYSVLVSNACGSATSATAVLDVYVRAGDLDHDGDIDHADWLMFADCLAGPDVPYLYECADADMDDDNDVDIADLSAFQLEFEGSG